MSGIKKCFICVLAALMVYPILACANNFIKTEQIQTIVTEPLAETVTKDQDQSKPVLAVAPREINLGIIAADKSQDGIFTLNNAGSGVIHWSTEGPEGWEKTEKPKLSGVLKDNPDFLRIEISLFREKSLFGSDASADNPYYVVMKLESADKMVCRKQLPLGTHKEAIKINSNGGQKTVFVTFSILYTQKSPFINLDPLRLDMGSVLPDKTVSRRITLTNSGKEMLKWSVALRKKDGKDMTANVKKGRYISFLNEGARTSGAYTVPGHLKDTLQFSGNWKENQGYPSSSSGEHVIHLNFSGTGVELYLLAYPENVNMVISLDKRRIDNPVLRANLKENKRDLLIADSLEDGPHALTITSRNSGVIFEGVKITGESRNTFPAGSIRIVPNSGATTRQTNYISVTLNTEQMPPGYYADDIVFDTNSGEGVVEIFAEIVPDTELKIIDVYRYYNGIDYMFTAHPQAETNRLVLNKYGKEGIAFRLFSPGTPGTTEFFRWYNPQKKSHFYHYNSAGGGKDLRGYVLEGSIGNIATSRLTNTRELYRWYNSRTGHYFYTTNAQGGTVNKKMYRFDGIAGYVR